MCARRDMDPECDGASPVRCVRQKSCISLEQQSPDQHPHRPVAWIETGKTFLPAALRLLKRVVLPN